MDQVKIDVFKKSDEEQVVSLILQIQRNEFGIEITEQDQPDLKIVSSFYQSGNGQFWVAKIDSKIVGTIALLDIGEQNCAIRKMFVEANHRGPSLKIAQKLLDKLIHWSMTNNVHSIYLGTIDRYKAALRFYQKNGFQECSKNHLPASFPLISVDNVFYCKNL